ncbi:hypothetical protein DFH07DRAFT_755774 [Mycena maculata]|uniref:NmrA-like domain-containing protein n=1 Tax=Mycena maculata TaxID=230809 RepID=A0AAD7MUE4_9AGAR|nr:hypothetical protein DFH07DRAFT_755774 [Mycena maculata]
MTILLTGGTGKSATPLAKLLLEANHPVLLANRSGNVPAPFKGARFDWLDTSTYKIPFEADSNIDRVYIIAPGVTDMFPPMKAFIDFAVERGVKRFVLLSAGLLEPGGPAMGKAHEYLDTLNVEYCALRPSWFFDNFVVQYADRIKSKNEIVSAAKDGQVGWVSTEDIADVAFKALIDDVIQNDNPIIVGPELFSYDQIAALLSEILGREIKHTRLTEAELKEVMVARGMPESYGQMMAMLDGFVAQGAEEQLFHKANVVGKRTLRAFFEANKDVWRTAD